MRRGFGQRDQSKWAFRSWVQKRQEDIRQHGLKMMEEAKSNPSKFFDYQINDYPQDWWENFLAELEPKLQRVAYEHYREEVRARQAFIDRNGYPIEHMILH